MPINRRKFLKQSTIAIAGVSLARLPIISATVAPKKIIIIGAGMAGLSAGYELSQAGHDVTILERGRAVGCKLCANLSQTACMPRPARRAFPTIMI
jgi:monoamine oxidase